MWKADGRNPAGSAVFYDAFSSAMDQERIEKQFSFIREIDREKFIEKMKSGLEEYKQKNMQE